MAEMVDDFVVVIVGNDDADIKSVKNIQNVVKEVILDKPAEELINVAKEYGVHVNLENVKEERLEYDYEHSDTEYLKDTTADDIEKYTHNELDYDYNCGDDYISDEQYKLHEPKSFVRELIKKNPQLKEDQTALIDELVEVMRNIRPPQLPRDYCAIDNMIFECSKCGVVSETEAAASRHYQNKHGERYLKCFACGADFRSTTNLYKHEKRCMASDALVVLKARAILLGRKGSGRPFLRHDLRNSKPRCSTAPKKYYCDQCSAVFLTKIAFKSHQNHHQGIRPFQCKECPNTYTSPIALKTHEKTHTDIQFICDHCGRSFKLKANLSTHMNTHEPLKKFACTECDKRYSKKRLLQMHVDRDHRHLPPPCACRLCPRRYTCMTSLKKHMEKAHDMMLITRKMFFKSVPSMPDVELGKAKVVLNSKLMESDDYLEMRAGDK